MVGAIFETNLTEIFTQVVEAAAGIGAIVAGFQQIELARKYYDLYKQQRDFYYTVFHTGVEVPLISEIYNKAYYNRDYAARVATLYNSVTGPLGGASGDTLGWWTRHANMYGQSPDEEITELEADNAKLRSDWSNYLFRFEELWADVRNDSRWSARLMVHNLGLKQGTAVAASMNSALGQYQDNITDLSNQLATYGNGIARYAGYKRGMSDTANDFNHGTTFNGNGNGSIPNNGGMMHANQADYSPISMRERLNGRSEAYYA